MHIRCQNCSQEMQAPRWQLGMVLRCPNCGRETLLARDSVVAYLESRWDVTFLDFVQLVIDPAYQIVILPLLRSFVYERSNSEPVRFRDGNGRTLKPEEVHIQIQNDEQMQYRLYQAAMDLWR